jgi:hypothetical protein
VRKGGQGVEHQALRLQCIHLREHGLHAVVELHLGELEQRGRARGARLSQVAHPEAGEIPAVGCGDRVQLVDAFRERNEQHGLAAAQALQRELQAERGLAGAGCALDEVEVAGA